MSRTYRKGRNITGIPAREPSPIDVKVYNEGSIYMIAPLTDVASTWMRDNVSSDSQWFGGSLAAEPGYVGELVEAMINDGLIVE